MCFAGIGAAPKKVRWTDEKADISMIYPPLRGIATAGAFCITDVIPGRSRSERTRNP
jgi:hypothetical protein